MIYSDNEIKDWWKKLSHFDKCELFVKMKEKMSDGYTKSFAESLYQQWKKGKELSPKQLMAIRKWE